MSEHVDFFRGLAASLPRRLLCDLLGTRRGGRAAYALSLWLDDHQAFLRLWLNRRLIRLSTVIAPAFLPDGHFTRAAVWYIRVNTTKQLKGSP